LGKLKLTKLVIVLGREIDDDEPVDPGL